MTRRFKATYHTETSEQEEGRKERNRETIREWRADPIDSARMLRTASDCLTRYHQILDNPEQFRPQLEEETYEQYDEARKSFLRIAKMSGVQAFLAYFREMLRLRLH